MVKVSVGVVGVVIIFVGVGSSGQVTCGSA